MTKPGIAFLGVIAAIHLQERPNRVAQPQQRQEATSNDGGSMMGRNAQAITVLWYLERKSGKDEYVNETQK